MTLTNFCFAKHVHHLFVDGEFILLDEKLDLYFLFDKEDSEDLLRGMASGQRNKIIEKCLAANLLKISDHLTPIKSIESYRTGMGNYQWQNVRIFRNKGARADHYLIATLLVFCVVFSLRILGLGTTLRLARNFKNRSANATKKSITRFEFLERISCAIFQISKYFPVRVRCLESSISVLVLASMLGIKSVLKIGVQRYDFLAHAWIQIDDIIIGDDQALRDGLPVILEI